MENIQSQTLFIVRQFSPRNCGINLLTDASVQLRNRSKSPLAGSGLNCQEL